jgi:hypothetical protein
MSNTKYRHGISFPLILIGAGAILFLSNIHVLSGDAWDLFVHLWPFLFIISGLDGIYQGRGAWVNSTVNIGLGALFLAANYGLVPWNGFDLLLRLWPVLIIAWGIDLLVGRRSMLASGLGVVLVGLTIAGVLWMSASPLGFILLKPQAIQQDAQAANHAVVELDRSTGNLVIDAGEKGNQLFSGTVALPLAQTIKTTYSVNGNTGTLAMKDENPVWVPVLPSSNNSSSWTLHFNPQIPLDIKANLGVGSLKMDLRGLGVTEVNANTALGQLEIMVPEKAAYSIQANNAMGNTVISVPRDLPVEIFYSGAIAHLSLPEGYQRSGEKAYSPNYSSALPALRITISQAIGLVQISYQD